MLNYDYSQHLLKRGFLGKIYRKFYLYPKILAKLSRKMINIGCGIGDFLEFKKGVVTIIRPITK